MRSDGIINEWWDTGHAQNIHKYLLKRERRCKKFSMSSPQLEYRSSFIKYLDSVCELFSFCGKVKHLAVYILDHFMDSYIIQKEHFPLVILSCLIVAVKVDEQDALIPKMSKLNALLNNAYNLKYFVDLEIFIMEFFEWDLVIPTVATFVEYYSLYALLDTDYLTDESVLNMSQVRSHIASYIDYFLELTLRVVNFRKFRASVVAASCVAAARICFMLAEVWPCQLSIVTHYELADLKLCLEMIIQYSDLLDIYSSHKVPDCSDKVSDHSSSGSSSSSLSTSDS